MVTIIVLLLIIGLLLLVVIPYVTRETRVSSVEILEMDELPEVGGELFLRHFEVLSGCQLHDSNRVDILLNGDGTYDRMIDELGTAKKSISWHVFFHRPGKLSDRVREALIERAKAGVKVNFLYDYFGADGLNGEYLDGLRDAGVQVNVFRPLKWNLLYKIGQRMHIRAVVIDGDVAYTGGFGIDDRWLGDGRTEGSWRDTNVRIEGPSVDQLQGAFIANWAESSAKLLMGEDLFGEIEDDEDARAGDVRAGIMHTDPSIGSTNAERFFVLSIAMARSSICLTTPYFVPDGDFRKLLIEAANRGVDVRILDPGWKTDMKPAYFAGRAHLDELMEAGIRIFEYEPTMIHAKSMVVDGKWGFVGTINFDNRSMMLNDEVAMVFSSSEIGRQLVEIFEDDLTRAREVDLEEFRSRPLWQKATEQLSRTIAHVL